MKIKKDGKEIEIKTVEKKTSVSPRAISNTPPTQYGNLTDFNLTTPESALNNDAIIPIGENAELKQLKYEDFKNSFEDYITQRTNVIGYEKFNEIKAWTPVGAGTMEVPYIVNNAEFVQITTSPSIANIFLDDTTVPIGGYFYIEQNPINTTFIDLKINGKEFIQPEISNVKTDKAVLKTFQATNLYSMLLKLIKVEENLYYVENIMRSDKIQAFVNDKVNVIDTFQKEQVYKDNSNIDQAQDNLLNLGTNTSAFLNIDTDVNYWDLLLPLRIEHPDTCEITISLLRKKEVKALHTKITFLYSFDCYIPRNVNFSINNEIAFFPTTFQLEFPAYSAEIDKRYLFTVYIKDNKIIAIK